MTEAEFESPTSAPRPGRVVKGFLGILTGSTVAQLMAIAALPILARLYTPADTAHYAMLLGIGAVLASFASLRLDLAIPIPQSVNDSRRLFWLAAVAPLLVVPIVGTLAGILHLAGVWRAATLDWVDYLAISAFVFVLSIYTAGSQLAIRLRSYGLLGRIPLIQMSGTLATQMALGVVGIGRGLFVGGLLGRSLGIVRLMRTCEVRLAQVPPRREAVRLLKEYWRFPAIFAPATLIEALGWNLAAVMLPSLFGFGPAGLYAMAARVSGVPAGVLTRSAGQVFLGEFARSSQSSALRVFLRWSAAMLLMGVAVASAIWVLAPLVLPWFLGTDWEGTVVLAQYSGVMAGAQIFASPFHSVWEVRQRGLLLISWNLIRLGVTAGVIWTGAQAGDSMPEVIWSLAIATTGVYILSWVGCLWAAARTAPRAHALPPPPKDEGLAGADGIRPS